MVWLEPEELVLDTLEMRARVLTDVLTEYGVPVELAAARAAHRGVPTTLALDTLAAGMDLDLTARQLVARTCADRVASATAWVIPALLPDTREGLAALSSARRVHALTRSDRATMHRWLEALELSAYIQRITSVDDMPADGVRDTWARAAEEGVAVVPRAAATAMATSRAYTCSTLDPTAVQDILALSAD